MWRAAALTISTSFLRRFCHQAAFDVVAVDGRHAGGQHVDGPADHPQLILADRSPAGYRGGQHAPARAPAAGRTSWRPRPDACGDLHAAFDLLGATRNRAQSLSASTGA